ncbi:MAG: hypothetical protein M0P12_13545, partial [Paludibacteraceae bacterium]|nr:hypothetical protein [Paludibacteraceae bacterium]
LLRLAISLLIVDLFSFRKDNAIMNFGEYSCRYTNPTYPLIPRNISNLNCKHCKSYYLCAIKKENILGRKSDF